MIRKLPSTLYKKLVDEHKLWALRNGVSIPEDNIELHQQIAMSPALNKNMQSCMYLFFMYCIGLTCLILFYDSFATNYRRSCIDTDNQGCLYCWSGQDDPLCTFQANQVATGQIVCDGFPCICSIYIRHSTFLYHRHTLLHPPIHT